MNGGLTAFIIIIAIAVITVVVILGLKGCIFMADMFGIDHRYIPRKTFSPNGLWFGALFGILFMLLSKSIIAGVIIGIIIGVGAWIGIFFIEVAITKATTPLSDKIEEKIDSIFSNGSNNSDIYNNANSNSTGYGISGSSYKDEVAANEWRCPKCKTINPKYVGTCNCGCTLEAYNRQQEIMKKQLAEKRKAFEAAEKEKIATQEKELNNLLANFKEEDLSSGQQYAMKIIARKQGLTLPEICKQLPRSANLKEFKDALNYLTEKGIIRKDKEERYYLEEKNTCDKKDSNIADSASEEKLSNNITSDENTNNEIVSADSKMDKYEELRKLKELLDEGIISEDEFAAKKKELLGL